MFQVIAHRGHQGCAPESTIQAFDAAVRQGFTHIETDVQLTKDLVPIILHDEQLGRTVQGSGPVADCLWQDLQGLDAGSWWEPPAHVTCLQHQDYSACRIPTLAQVLNRYVGRIHLHLELKSRQPELPQAVAADLLTAGWVDNNGQLTIGAHCNNAQPGQQLHHPNKLQTMQPTSHPAFATPGLTITSFHVKQLAASKKLLPGVRHGWLVQELHDPGLFEDAKAAGVEQLCPRANALTPEAVAAAKRQGFTVRAWRLKREQDVVQAFMAGADGGTADYPDVTEALVRKLQGRPGA